MSSLEAKLCERGKSVLYPGTPQWPMTVENQKKAGLIAMVNRSIHPRNWLKAKQKISATGSES